MGDDVQKDDGSGGEWPPDGWLAAAGYAEAGGEESLDLGGGWGEVGGGEEAVPVGGAEAAEDGDRAVVLDEGVPGGEAGGEREEGEGDRLAVEVVDEPAEAGLGLHPAEELDDFGVGEVVGEQRADDDVDGGVRGVGLEAGLEESDGAGEGDFASGADDVGVEVNAGEADGEVVVGGPAADAAEHVAGAAAYVDDVEGAGLEGEGAVEGGEEGEGGAVGEGEAVDAGEVAEGEAEIRVGTRAVEELGKLGEVGTFGEVEVDGRGGPVGCRSN